MKILNEPPTKTIRARRIGKGIIIIVFSSVFSVCPLLSRGGKMCATIWPTKCHCAHRKQNELNKKLPFHSNHLVFLLFSNFLTYFFLRHFPTFLFIIVDPYCLNHFKSFISTLLSRKKKFRTTTTTKAIYLRRILNHQAG